MNSTLTQRDRALLWHPATHFSDLDQAPAIPIRRAKGCWLETTEGERIYDAISSWWTCVHGHGHPAISQAIAHQAQELDHVMFAGFTHEPAVALAEALVEGAPSGYGKVFYSDCGSASIEVALKLSYQWRLQSGEAGRNKFAALQHSYHGETMGALALCASEAYRVPFGPLLVDVTYLPVPRLLDHTQADLQGDAGADSPELKTALALLDKHAHELTALVVEPLVQCAGRMSMHGVGYYRRLVEHAQSLGIHVIADEIAVAFGRTGKLFASEWAGVQPDLLCCSKGLSGGVLPLAATLTKKGFEAAFEGSPERSFMHSHTFTGNPIACAAGLANLKLFQSQAMSERREALIADLESASQHVAENSAWIAHRRQAGCIVAFDLHRKNGASAGRLIPQGRLGLALRQAALRRGLLLRPLHDTIYWMPPLVAEAKDISDMANKTLEVISEVLGTEPPSQNG